MMLSSPVRPEALVRSTGRTLRRVAGIVARALLVGVVAMLTGVMLAPAALAHEGADKDIGAVLDHRPDMPGVALTVETTPLGPQFVLENPTPTTVTILSSVGDPLFKVGPDGVLGNIRSPEWYTSKTPDGAITIPARAAEKGVPVWLKVSSEPNWGWFDHRLHAVTLTPDQKKNTAPLARIGTWTVPLQYGDTLGSVDGHFEYRPVLGSFIPTVADTTPAPDIRLTPLPGNPRPGLAIENSGNTEVIVLGDQNEPYLRISPAGTEANGASPTWIASQNPAAQGAFAGDPKAAPQWVAVGAAPNYAFTLKRGEPAQDLAELYTFTEPTVVRDWQLTLVVNGRPLTVDGKTTMTPANYHSSGWLFWLAIGGGVLLVGALAVAGVWLLRRRRAAAANRPRPTTTPTGKKARVSATP